MRCTVTLRQTASGQPLLQRVRWGASFISRWRGFMFRRALAPGEALLMVEPRESRLGTSIHMLFVGFPLGVVWLDDSGRVVDKVVAQPWRPFYAPRAPARYTLETHPDFLPRVALGDVLAFDDDNDRA
jgi:uncharacterized membrane protein (UPF0127 family)